MPIGRPTKVFAGLPHDWQKHKVQLGIQIPAKYVAYLEEVIELLDGVDSIQDLIKIMLLEKYPPLLDKDLKANYFNSLKEEFDRIQAEKAEKELEENEGVIDEEEILLNGKHRGRRSNKIDPDEVEPLAE